MKAFVTSFYSRESRWKERLHPIQVALASRGYSIEGARGASVYVAIDFKLAGLVAAIFGGIKRRNRVLIVQEPKVVLPQNHWSALNFFFGRIIYLGRQDESLCFPWPQSSLANTQLGADFQGVRQETNAVLVASDRLSLVRGENYSLRRRLATLSGVHTYGRDWKLSPINKFKRLLWAVFSGLQSGTMTLMPLVTGTESPKNFFGPVADKQVVTSRYNVALVVENSSDYYSEKIFDAFASGCFPVYVGYDRLATVGIPENFFIQSEPCISSVEAALSSASKVDFSTYRAELAIWLRSELVASKWSEINVWNEVLNVSLSEKPG